MNPDYEGGALQVGACDKMQIKGEMFKNKIRIGFINIAGIRGKSIEVEEMIVKEKLDVIGIGETWLRADDVFSGKVLVRKDDMNYVEFDTMNRPKRGKRGIMVIGNKKKEILTWNNEECNTQGFINIKLEGINVIFVYIPPLETEEFIYKLEKEIQKVKNKTIVLGDFNIDSLKSEHRLNKFKLLEEIMETNKLRRIPFKNEQYGAYTFAHKDGISIIDQIWSNIREVDATISEISNTSDHELIIAEVHLNIKQGKKKYEESIRTVYRPSEKQKLNIELAKRFNNRVKDDYIRINENVDIESMYEMLIKGMVVNYCKIYKPKDTAGKVVEKKKTIIVTDKLKFWMAVRQRIKRDVFRTGNYRILMEVKVLIRKEIRSIKYSMWKDHIQEFKEMDYAKLAEKFSKISKKEAILHNPIINIEEKTNEIFPYQRKKSGIIIRNFRSKVRTKENERKKSKRVFDDKLELVDLEELKMILKSLKNGSAPGISGVTYELFKLLDNQNLSKWVNLYNGCLKKAISVEKWNFAVTVAIPKKDGGVRPITLLETARKIYEKIIYTRLIQQTNISAKQCGFMKDKDTYLQIINVEATIRQMSCKQLCLAFLDIRKAYDTVKRKLLYEKMKKHNGGKINRYLIKIISLLFDYNHVKMIFGRKMSEEIWLERGLLQGSKLSPILYNIFMNDFTDKIDSSCKISNTECFLYADDIVIISKTTAGMKKALRLATDHSKENEYEFNVDKCAFISKTEDSYRIKDKIIKKVKTFEYLGCIFNIHGMMLKQQIQRNINKTRNKWYKVEKYGLLGVDGLSVSSKIILIKSILIPTLEYGLVFSIRKKSYIEKIQCTVTSYIRRIFGITKNSKVNNTNWLGNIEMRKENYKKKLYKIYEKIRNLNEYTFKMMINQESFNKKRKSKLMEQILENREFIGSTRDENIANTMSGCKHPHKFIEKVTRMRDWKFIVKYLADDLNYNRNGVMIKLKVDNYDIIGVIRSIVNDSNPDLGKEIKIRWIEEIGS
jgi:hypothetical protein